MILFQEALDYHTYCRVDEASWYDDEVAGSIAKWVKHLQVPIERHMFDFFYPISIFGFLSASLLVYDKNNIQERSLVTVGLFRGASLRNCIERMHFTPIHVAESPKRRYSDVVGRISKPLIMNRIGMRQTMLSQRRIRQTMLSQRRMRQTMLSQRQMPIFCAFLDHGVNGVQNSPKRYEISCYDATESMKSIFPKESLLRDIQNLSASE